MNRHFLLLLMFMTMTNVNLQANVTLNPKVHKAETSRTMGLDENWNQLQAVIDECERLQNEGEITKMGQYFVNKVKTWNSKDDKLLLALAKLTNSIRDVLQNYNWQLAANTNMYNAAVNMTESYTLSLLDVDLKTLRVRFALQSANLGNSEAKQLLQAWNVQTQVSGSSGSYQSGNGNNSSRINQLLNNIATYQRRINEVEVQVGSGVATRAMANQTIAGYKRMIEEAKRELRSLGYNIY